MATHEVLGEIDIDSDRPAAFGATDRELLEADRALLAPQRCRLNPSEPKPDPTYVHTITLIPGDGIGPEVTEAVVRILKAAQVEISGNSTTPA